MGCLLGQKKRERDTQTLDQKNNTLVSENTGGEKNLNPGDLNKIYIYIYIYIYINLVEFFK